MPFVDLITPEPYTNIKIMVKKYHDTMRKVSHALNQGPSSIKLDIQNEPIGYLLTPGDFQRMKDNISTLDGFVNYLILFGIDPETDNLTFCVVGADANGNVLQTYKDKPDTFGEEKWPTKCKAKLSDTSLDSFLE